MVGDGADAAEEAAPNWHKTGTKANKDSRAVA